MKGAAKSSKAQAVLPNAAGLGRGFGGFTGSQAIDPRAAAAFQRTPTAAAQPQEAEQQLQKTLAADQELDRELAQCLQHLGKRDSTTRLKALQTFSALVASKPASAVISILRPWCYVYAKLSMDSNRAVRLEAARLLGQLVAIAGRAATPHLRMLMGPWVAAQQDPHAETVSAARSAFQTCFPSEQKRGSALLFCCSEAVTHLTSNVLATPDQLSDARRDSGVEIEERYERVVSSSLRALSSMVDVLAQQETALSAKLQSVAAAAGTKDAAASDKQQQQDRVLQQQLQDGLRLATALPTKPNFFKTAFGCSSPVVRASAYGFVASLSTAFISLSASEAAASADSSVTVPPESPATLLCSSLLRPTCACAVLGAFGEKESAILGAVLEMVLVYLKAAPDCWQLPGAADSLLRTLPPLLRDSWRGAGPVCWPALLPFLTLLPWQLNPSAADTQQQQQQQQQPIQGRATAAEGESAEGAKRSGKGSKKGQGQVEQVKQGLTHSPQEMLLMLLSSTWQGMVKARGSASSTRGSQLNHASPAAAFAECVSWAMLQSPLSPPAAEQTPAHSFNQDAQVSQLQSLMASVMGAAHTPLSQHTAVPSPVSLALCLTTVSESSSNSRDLGEDVVVGVVAHLTTAAAKPAATQGSTAVNQRAEVALHHLSQCLASQAVAAMEQADPQHSGQAGAVSDGPQQCSVFSACEQLLSKGRLTAAAPSTAHALAVEVAAWLVRKLKYTGDAAVAAPLPSPLLSPDATRLLATLVSQHSSQVAEVAGVSLDKLALDVCKQYLQHMQQNQTVDGRSNETEAVGDLVLACLQNARDPTAAWQAASSVLITSDSSKEAVGLRLATCLVSSFAQQHQRLNDSPAIAAFSSMAEVLVRQVLAFVPPSTPTSHAAAQLEQHLPAAHLLSLLLGANPGRVMLVSVPAARLVVQALAEALPSSASYDACSQAHWTKASAAMTVLSSALATSPQQSTPPLLHLLPEEVASMLLPSVLSLVWVHASPATSTTNTHLERKRNRLAHQPIAPSFWQEQLQLSSGYAVGGLGGGDLNLNLSIGARTSSDAEESEGSESDEDAFEGSDVSASSHASSQGDEEETASPSEVGSAAAGAIDIWRECACSLAAAVWAEGRFLQQVLPADEEGRVASDARQHVVQGVACVVQHGLLEIAREWGEQSSSGGRSRACALWAKQATQAVTAMDHAPDLQQALIQSCLGVQSPKPSSQQQQHLCPHWCLWSDGTSDAGGESTLHAVMLAFTSQLALSLPPAQLLCATSRVNSSSSEHAAMPRAWLLEELLCAEQEQQQHPERAKDAASVGAACAVLVEGLLAGLSSEQSNSAAVLQQVVTGLVRAAQQHSPDASLLATQALRRLLAQMAVTATDHSAATSLLESICSVHLMPLLAPTATSVPHNVPCSATQQLLLHCLPIVSAALRHCHQQNAAPIAASLSQLSTALLAFPLASDSSSSTQDSTLQLALAALPVPVPACFSQQQNVHSPAATAEEVQALRKLLHHQHLHRVPQQQSASSSGSDLDAPCSSEVLLHLVAASYCHPQLNTSEWRTVLGSCKQALEHADALMQQQVQALASAVTSATASLLGGGTSSSAEGQEVPEGTEQGDASVVPVMLWRILLGADAVQSRMAGRDAAEQASSTAPLNVPHASLLQGMAKALGTSSSVSGSGQGQNQEGVCGQLDPAHALAAQLLHAMCCLSPHTPHLLAATSSAPAPALGASDASTPTITHAPVLGQCVQLAVQLLGWAGALQGVCVMCGGSQGGVVAAQWPGWQQQRSNAAGAQTEEEASCSTSPFWSVLSHAVTLTARMASGSAGSSTDTLAPSSSAAPLSSPEDQDGTALQSMLHQCLSAALTSVSQALERLGLGLDVSDALLALVLSPPLNPASTLAEGAYLLLLAAPVLDLPLNPLATGYVSTGGDRTEEQEEEEEENDLTQLHHPAAYLMRTVGLKPLLAEALIDTQPLCQHRQQARHQLAPLPPRAYLTAWALLLAHLMHRKSSQSQPQDQAQGPEAGDKLSCRLPVVVMRGVCTALREVPHLVPALMDMLSGLLPLRARPPGKKAQALQQSKAESADAVGAVPTPSNPAGAAAAARAATTASIHAATASAALLAPTLLRLGLPHTSADTRHAATLLYGAALRLLPASARQWFGDLRSREKAAALERYTAEHHSPGMVAIAIASMEGLGSSSLDGSAEENGGGGSFSVRANLSAREVVAVLEVEEGSTLELVIRLPSAMPLKAPDVECRRNMGVADARLRKWLLSISSALRNANCSIADAIAQWQVSVRAEFSGLEPCLICYSVVAATGGGALPRLQCRTCHVRFHPACLYKWFKSSGKSTCPHCQSPW